MKLKIKKALSVVLSLACLTPIVSNAQDSVSGEWATNGHEVNHNIEHPNPLKSYLKAPRFYSQDDLSSVAVGMSSDDVRSLLGNPHFNEFFTKEWNYIVGSVKNGVDFCQLQIRFDKNKLVSGIYWNTNACMSDYSSSNSNNDMNINLDSDSLSKAVVVDTGDEDEFVTPVKSDKVEVHDAIKVIEESQAPVVSAPKAVINESKSIKAVSYQPLTVIEEPATKINSSVEGLIVDTDVVSTYKMDKVVDGMVKEFISNPPKPRITLVDVAEKVDVIDADIIRIK